MNFHTMKTVEMTFIYVFDSIRYRVLHLDNTGCNWTGITSINYMSSKLNDKSTHCFKFRMC